jgi:hypothetical protein
MFFRILRVRISIFARYYLRNTNKLLILKIFKKFIGFKQQTAIELDSASLNTQWNGLKIEQIKMAEPHTYELRDEKDSILEIRSFQSVFEYGIPGAIIDATSGAVFEDKSNPRPFFESAPFAIESLSESIRPRFTRQRILGEVAVLSNRSFHHWLIDDLPRFLSIFERRPKITVLVDSMPRSYVHDVLEILQPENVVYRSVSRVEKVFFISAGNIESFPSMRDVDTLRRFAEVHNLVINKSRMDRIFISRRFGPSRNSLEAIFEELAKEANFRVLHFENIALRDQIEIFSNASVIVASNGAVFANLVWCKPNTNVYNIYDHNWDTDSVRDLCLLLNLSYRKVHNSMAKNLFEELR